VVRVRATRAAKQLMDRVVLEDVIGNYILFFGSLVASRVFGREEFEFVGSTFRAPKAKFAADCAVAFGGAFGKIEGGGEFDCAADATSVVRLLAR
jgi:hypothetical protein